ncbi:hypothetical protein AWH56_022125 [Anaerobacillus isosaccharinicus]|uniref:Uncharacterized protein n=1 Tax=Anaerobacillus isosaccharinicus TaxID=1532552 RepID=A0A1S2M4Q7_9BACI|nr:hypothetical protein [Anaerobacillus isosaccharinicus]MBA5586398.1 hypothetical protein [Anaerobacillus isosaccharinicus]QOY35357.1 hypothetical protein AWH56_022125 [Anaerobacillus isosaccharinicus]
MIEVTTEDEFQYHKWRTSYIIVKDSIRTLVHKSNCNDVNLAKFRERESNSDKKYFFTLDLDLENGGLQAEKCYNCWPE